MSVEAKKDFIIEQLKKHGCRITNQRLILIDILLNDDCGSCKEIYYRAMKMDPTIGMATVYRLIKTLEETGLMQRRNLYQIECKPSLAPV